MGTNSTTNGDMGWLATLGSSVLAGEPIERDTALAILALTDDQTPVLLEQTRKVREHHHGRRVKLCLLRNARSGICPEDCHYCSQSSVSKADISRYKIDSADQLLEGAKRAVATGARRFCMVTSGRGPNDSDIERFSDAARRIKGEYPDIELCVSAGLMDEGQARALKDAGIGWVNHNLNTSERHHPAICTTHTYEDRIRTIENVKKAGLSTCCGGIIGMGETDEDVVDLAFALRELHVDSLPVNFLIPIEGTPLQDRADLTPQKCLRTLCLFRLTNPEAEIRVAGGREHNLKEFQSESLFAANSIFVEGYLTTPGQAYRDAHAMVTDLGFEVEPGLEGSVSAAAAPPA